MNVTVFVHSRSLYIIFTNSCVRTKTVVTLQKVYHTHLVSIGFGTKVMRMCCQCIKAYHNNAHKHTYMCTYTLYICIFIYMIVDVVAVLESCILVENILKKGN